MQLQIKPLTAMLFGVGFVLALAFLLNGRDYSPSTSVASSEHSAVAPMANAETAWQSNSRRAPGPEQVIVQQPPTVIVQLPEGVYPTAASSSPTDDLRASGTGATGTGWRTPKVDLATGEEDTASASSSDLPAGDGTYANEARTQGLTDCDALAQRIHDTHDYRGTGAERACFGEEDDPRVGLALDYGMTEDSYAANEARGGGSATNPHPGYASCASEDSPGPCAWDAQAQGNGSGHSFLRDADGTVTYLN